MTDATALDTDDGFADDVPAQHLFDLDAQVQRWVSTTDINNGLVLKVADESLNRSGPAWDSSESIRSGVQRPKLNVVFSANSTHAYPVTAAPASFTGQVQADWDPFGTAPRVPPAPRRSAAVGTDGSFAFVEGTHQSSYSRLLRTLPPPYTTSTNSPITDGDTMTTDIAVDGDTAWLTGPGDLAAGIGITKYVRSGTTWTQSGAKVNVGGPLRGPALSIYRETRGGNAGRLWLAYRGTDALLNPHLFVNYSDDAGATFPNEVDLGQVSNVYAAQFAAYASLSLGLLYQDGASLLWRSSPTSTSTATTVASVDGSTQTATSWQAVRTDDGGVHLVTSTAAAGVLHRRYSSSTWSLVGTIASGYHRLSLSTDGAQLYLATDETSSVGLRRFSNGMWSSVSSVGTPGGAPSMPARVDSHSLPVAWDASDLRYYVNVIDDLGADIAVTAPAANSMLAGTTAISVTASDSGVGPMGVSRVEFYVDRGAGFIGYLGCVSGANDSTCPSQTANGTFTYSWDTAEVDTPFNKYGTGGRLWPEGAYRLYAVAWDYDGHRTESPRVDASVVVNDLGLHPYRPTQPFELGHGVNATVNLHTGNLVVTQTDVSDPTVIGPLSASRTHNSQDALADRRVGSGWALSADTAVDLIFRQLVNHANDSGYPSGTIELVESNGTQHFYFSDGSGLFSSYAEDRSRLAKNGDGSWTLSLSDGTRWDFRADGQPSKVTLPQTGTGQSFNYGYDGGGALTSMTEPTGRAISVEYVNGKVDKVRDFDTTRFWQYAYIAGDLTSVTDPAGHSTQYAYDAQHRITQITDARGSITYFDYSGNRVSQVRQRHNGTDITTSFNYVSSSVTKATSYRGNLVGCDTVCKDRYTTTFTMDNRGRVIGITKPQPSGGTATKQIGWDEAANLSGADRPRNLKTSETDFLGRRTNYVYDEVGNTTAMTDSDNKTTSHAYNQGYSGLVAEHYPNQTFTPSAGFPVRQLNAVDGSYAACGTPGTCSPDPAIPVDNFSSRYSGWIAIPTAGNWTFATFSDDGVRLAVDGRSIVNNWTLHGGTLDTAAPIFLSAGLHEIALEHFEATGAAVVQLQWSGPGVPGLTVVPQSSLRPGLSLETKQTDPNGQAHVYTYDSPFQRHRISEEAVVTSGILNPSMTVKTVFDYTDPATGQVDAYGRLRKKIMPNGNGAASPAGYTTVYNYYGPNETTTNPCTNTVTPSQAGQLKSEVFGTSNATTPLTYFYDSRSNEVARTDGLGTTCMGYDADNRLTSKKAPDRATATTFAYDNNGNPMQIVDPVSGTSTYTYDDLNRILTAKDVYTLSASGALYGYDVYTPTTEVRTLTDAAGVKTVIQDELGRVTAIDYIPTGGSQQHYSFTYDANGDLNVTTLPNGRTIDRDYDTLRRLTGVTYGETFGTLATFNAAYDASSRRTSELTPNGPATYQYDSIGRLERAHDPLGYVRSYTYDRNSNRTQLKTNAGLHYQLIDNTAVPPMPPGTPVLTPLVFTDVDNGSVQVNLPFAIPFYGTTVSSLWVSVNGYVSLQQNTTPIPNLRTTAGVFALNADWGLNTRGTVLTRQNDAFSPTWFSIEWSVFPADSPPGSANVHNALLSIFPNGDMYVQNFSGNTDDVYQVGASAGDNVNYVDVTPLKKWSNPRLPGYSGSNQPALALRNHSQTTASFSYDAIDRLSPDATHLFDSAGNSTRVGNSTYAYDGRSLLTSATENGATALFAYDGEGRQVKTTVGGADTLLRYAAPGDSGVSYETNASGTLSRSYLTGPGGLLATYTPTTAAYQLPDIKGSIWATMNSSSLSSQPAYSEFGGYEGEVAGGSASPVSGYLGAYQKRTDTNSGVLLMGRRGYDPELGRFLQRDPVRGGSSNDYDYVNADPINNLDLTGEYCVTGKVTEYRFYKDASGKMKKVKSRRCRTPMEVLRNISAVVKDAWGYYVACTTAASGMAVAGAALGPAGAAAGAVAGCVIAIDTIMIAKGSPR